MASQVAKQATRQPWYFATLQKLSNIYVNLAGYRKMGLKSVAPPNRPEILNWRQSRRPGLPKS